MSSPRFSVFRKLEVYFYKKKKKMEINHGEIFVKRFLVKLMYNFISFRGPF